MKKNLIAVLLAVAMITGLMSTAQAAKKFPAKPIKLVVYTKPGGAIDVFARKFTAVAAKYTDATFVVVNKSGAGGIIAMKYILGQKADGYKFAAVTRSNIGKIVSTGGKVDSDAINWMGLMVIDPEAVITSKNSKINTWEQLVADAKAKGGKQIWVGPAAGGNDHIMAMTTWKAAGIEAKWIPYQGGGKAMAALMGGHGVAYVGNPGDVVGRPDLKVAAVASPKRLGGEFADVPTFDELGVKGLNNEIMWRGFMTKKGIPADAEAFYLDLLHKVAADPEWQAYIAKGGAHPVMKGKDEFTAIVNKDKEVFTAALKSLGVLK